MDGSAPRRLLAVAVPVSVLAGGVIGFAVTSATGDHEAESTTYVEFDAVVDSRSSDGRTVCVSALDPTQLEKFGGSVCGPAFAADSTGWTEGARVDVQWFTMESTDGEAVDAFALSAPPE